MTARWVLAFAGSAALAAAMVAATLGSDEARPRAAAELSDLDVELLITKLREGDLLAIRKDVDGARRAWGEVRRRGQGIWMVHEGLGDSLRRAELGEEALREYAVAAELAPPEAVATIASKQGRVLESLGRLPAAAQAYLAAYPGIQLQPFLDLARRAGPADVMRRCRERAALDPRAWGLLAALADRFLEPALEAEARAREFIEAAPWDGDLALAALARLDALKRTDLALDVCRAWTKAAPTTVRAWRQMGDLLRNRGREKEALAAYASIVDVRPGQADAHRELAGIYRDLGRRDDAAAQLEAARRARPEDVQTWVDLLDLLGPERSAALAAEAYAKFPKEPRFRSLHVEAKRAELARLTPAEAVEARRALTDFPELGLYDVRVTLTWDVDGDVDLDVYEPGGETVFHGWPASKAGGRYYVDDTRKRGPETYTLAAAPKGEYRVGAHLHGDRKATLRAEIVLYEGTSRERRWTETARLEQGGDKRVFASFEIR